MTDNELFIYQTIIRGMSEGVLTINMNGRITSINDSAKKILALTDEIIGKSFASVFFTFSENDSFNQAVLDAVYENSVSHNVIADYFDGSSGCVKQLFINTSFMINNGEKIGVAAVFNDITELTELQNAVKAMEKIKALNAELEKRNEFIRKTFGRYLSDEIVSTILESEHGLEIGGKKQTVAIMFTDLRGFTAISEKMDPQDLIVMLNHYLSRMIEIIQRYNGTILEFIGDAIVAVFGAPLESETMDFDAVSCAVEMQKDMENVNIFNAKKGFPEIEMGIGIHTGSVVLGNIGSEKKTKYDIIGKNVNLASRIETFTVGGQILISPITKENLGDTLTVRGEMEIMPKGVKNPITIYDVYKIGNLVVPEKTEEFTILLKPAALKFRVIEEKSTSKEEFSANVTKYSKNEFVMQTDKELTKNTNIVFTQKSDDIYAKITQISEEGITAHVTMGKLNFN